MIDERETATPRISLVVPNYNHGQFIGQALDAMLAQTRPADEVIVVDDASTDNSVDLVSKRFRGQPGLILIRRHNRGGAVDALNEGLERATGELIAFPAADDLLRPDFLEKTTALMRRFSHAPFCSAGVELVDSDNRPMGVRPILRPMRVAGYTPPTSVRSMLIRGDNFFLGHVTLYRRERLVELGGFDPNLGATTDGMLQRRLAVRGGFCFVPEILGIWRMHGSNYSVWSAAEPKRLSELIKQCQSVIEAEPEGLFPDGYAHMFERRMRFYAARQALIRLGRDARNEEAVKTVCSLANAALADRVMFGIFQRLGPAAVLLSLAWLALRLRPLAFTWLGMEFVHRAFSARLRPTLSKSLV